MGAQEDVVRYSQQLGWVGLAAVVLGGVLAVTGSTVVGVVLVVLGVAVFLVTRYLIGRYRVS